MTRVEEIAKEIVAREGGFVNDPADPGGATNFGVTIGTLRSLGLGTSVADLRALTQQEAVGIFIKYYYTRPRINLLPVPLQASVFDMSVNSGSNAIEILQRLLAKFQQPTAVDGALGPNTAKAAKAAYAEAGKYLTDAYAIARRNYYFDLADRRPAMRKFARTKTGGKGGWIKRAEKFMQPKYRMTPDQFKGRVKAWRTI